MNLHALRIFTEVANTGSVTRSAENLLISQPAVTAQLRNLEKETGMKLVAAKGRSIELTEAGEMLAEHAKQLFALESRIEADMRAYKAGLLGHLRICSTDLPGHTLLPRWIAEYKEQYPQVEVQLSKGISRSALLRIMDRSVHLAIICGEGPREEAVEYTTIFEDELIFIAPSNHHLVQHEVSLADLAKEPFIFREEGSYIRKKLFSLYDAAGESRPKSSVTMEGLIESMEAVIAGYGLTLAPALAASKDLHSGKLAKLNVPGVHIRHPINLCTLKGEDIPPAAARFIAIVKQTKFSGLF